MINKRTYIFSTIIILLLGVILFAEYNKQNTVGNNAANVNGAIVFDSSRSKPNYPVFVSHRYNFTYSPVGNYGYQTSGPRLPLLDEINISTSSNTSKDANLELLMYENVLAITDDNVGAFDQWRQSIIYKDQSSSVSTVQVKGYTLFKAIQADGIDSRSAYYYLVRPKWIYVFVENEVGGDQMLSQVLENFKVNG